MINIDIACLDPKLSKKIAEALAKRLTFNEQQAIYVDPAGSLFSQAIKLVKTHEAITVPRQSQILLDAARDWEIKSTLLMSFWKDRDNRVLVNPISYALNFMFDWLVLREEIKKPFIKSLVKELLFKPDYIFYLDIPYDELRIKQKSPEYKRKVEYNMKGVGLKKRIAHYPELLTKLTDMLGSKCCIIEIGNQEDTNGIVSKIIEFIGEQ